MRSSPHTAEGGASPAAGLDQPGAPAAGRLSALAPFSTLAGIPALTSFLQGLGFVGALPPGADGGAGQDVPEGQSKGATARWGIQGVGTANRAGLRASRQADAARPSGKTQNGKSGFSWREMNAMQDLMTPLEPPPNVDPFQWSLDRARRQLIGTELLLVEPTPEAIAQARILLEEVSRDVLRLQRLASELEDPDRAGFTPPLLEFQQQLSRVSRLLQGAKRMQWARIRWVGALVQTYTSTGRARLWSPTAKTWTLEM
jgi:hypothetical protein